MSNVLEFKRKPRTATIKPEDIDRFYMELKNGKRVYFPDDMRYSFVLWLKSKGINEYYLDE